ncbi:unnamed protein product [Ilex paraguariensis]|uniref:Fungal lipase-type domain-containing protein n=1 Tax=Ilex paraguariensis TaxID=185542 RepID=A0ABC8T765_9AQUA
MSPKEDISEKWREIQGEIVKYGEFAQATYDAFDFDSFSEYCGSCRYNENRLFDKLGLNKHGYKVTKYIYAMSHIDLPRWLERSHLVSLGGQMEQILKLDGIHRSALPLLTAYEAASSLPGLHVSIISFDAPRVRNIAFRDELHQMGIKTLRTVGKQDLVPRMPGLVFNESLQKFDDITGTLDWVYTHVGAELKLDVWSSPYLKHRFNALGFHMLETYLHLVDGFHSKTSTFRSDGRRDVALVNKTCDMLVDELRIPHFWYQLANKGLECNEHGRWVKPKRDPEDIPFPTSQTHTHVIEMQENYGLIPLFSL